LLRRTPRLAPLAFEHPSSHRSRRRTPKLVRRVRDATQPVVEDLPTRHVSSVGVGRIIVGDVSPWKASYRMLVK